MTGFVIGVYVLVFLVKVYLGMEPSWLFGYARRKMKIWRIQEAISEVLFSRVGP